MKVYRNITTIIIVGTILAQSSCVKLKEEKVEVSQRISGTLFKSCEDPVPVDDKTLELRWSIGRGSPFYRSWSYQTTTDSNGHFTFSFEEENWKNGGKYDPHYAELRDSEQGWFWMEGIKPSDHELGMIYLERELP